MIKQGSEHTDQEILASLKQDIADINARIDMLGGALWEQHEINTLQSKTNKTLWYKLLILAPKRQDEAVH